MEMTTYKCPVCGFLYEVPAYWSEFVPEEKLEMEHFDFGKNEMCGEGVLRLVKA